MKRTIMKFVAVILVTISITIFNFVEVVHARRATITILYDNYSIKNGLISSNGFSCLIKGTEKTVLFDTGGDGKILFNNINQIKIDPKNVDVAVISHEHDDHTGGLLSFLSFNDDISIYLPSILPDGLSQQIASYNAKIQIVNKPFKICKGLYSTGVMGNGPQEQALILNSKRGLILITGCAHPGIVNIIEKAMRIFKKRVFFVFGGFHLKGKSDDAIKSVINKFLSLGVKKVGGSHCTGRRAMQLFKAKYGKNFIQMRVGKTIVLN
jgi:7,8-dihydropterin-6-yl-methyl-4-(beta-D-ribofuranosyl)aminobenzene 5'-phosphate synthase